MAKDKSLQEYGFHSFYITCCAAKDRKAVWGEYRKYLQNEDDDKMKTEYYQHYGYVQFRWWNDKQWSLTDFTLEEPKVIKESNALLAFEGFGSIGGGLENCLNISDFEL